MPLGPFGPFAGGGSFQPPLPFPDLGGMGDMGGNWTPPPGYLPNGTPNPFTGGGLPRIAPPGFQWVEGEGLGMTGNSRLVPIESNVPKGWTPKAPLALPSQASPANFNPTGAPHVTPGSSAARPMPMYGASSVDDMLRSMGVQQLGLPTGQPINVVPGSGQPFPMGAGGGGSRTPFSNIRPPRMGSLNTGAGAARGGGPVFNPLGSQGVGGGAASTLDDLASAAGGAGGAARGGVGGYLRAGLTSLNPLNYRGGAVPFPGANSFQNLASKIPAGVPGSRGLMTGLRAGVGSGILPGLGANIAGAALQGGSDTQSPWDNIVEAAGGGASFGAIGGLPGMAVGGLGGALGQGVAELMGNENGSFMDVLANSDVPVVNWLAQAGGDKEPTVPRPFQNMRETPEGRMQSLTHTLNSVGLDPQSQQQFMSEYNTKVQMYSAIYSANPQAFAVPDPNDESKTIIPTLDDVLGGVFNETINLIPQAVEAQGAEQLALQRAAAYQAMLGPYLDPLREGYQTLSDTARDQAGVWASRVPPAYQALLAPQADLFANQMTLESLNTERMLRSLPMMSEFQQQQDFQNQLDQMLQQQMMQQAVYGTDQQQGGSAEDELAALGL